MRGRGAKGVFVAALSVLIMLLGLRPGWAHHKTGHESGPKKDKRPDR